MELEEQKVKEGGRAIIFPNLSNLEMSILVLIEIFYIERVREHRTIPTGVYYTPLKYPEIIYYYKHALEVKPQKVAR